MTAHWVSLSKETLVKHLKFSFFSEDLTTGNVSDQCSILIKTDQSSCTVQYIELQENWRLFDEFMWGFAQWTSVHIIKMVKAHLKLFFSYDNEFLWWDSGITSLPGCTTQQEWPFAVQLQIYYYCACKCQRTHRGHQGLTTPLLFTGLITPLWVRTRLPVCSAVLG